MARTVMIQGTSSNVGKSLLVTALCRIYARRGIRVFPFKSQNMALNSYVTPEGLEIGRAQALQAVAAGRQVHVHMNPVLLKPEGNSRSQVVLLGKPWKTLQGREYDREKRELWEIIVSILDQEHRKNDLIIAEGAGSPAEINLKQDEIVNMSVAGYLKAPVLLAADIDRGGVFAFLYGTLALLEPDERELVKGFIINKFRGDQTLLEPGLDMLTALADNRPTLGVVPYMTDLALAQEDSVFLQEHKVFGEGKTDIAVILVPHISNYDDFDALAIEKGVRIRFVEKPEELGTPSAIILPGSKTTISDLEWLRKTGLADAVRQKASEGTAVVGICGGYQMLGTALIDEKGIEGTRGEFPGLGLLECTTWFEHEKRTIQASGVVLADAGFCASVTGSRIEGYEIHMGRTGGPDTQRPLIRTGAGTNDGAVSENGRIWGTYFHGVFDDVPFRRGWLRSLGWHATEPGVSLPEKRAQELDLLADTVEQNLKMELLDRIIGV
jgi:adenosylcobyric acid synthase